MVKWPKFVKYIIVFQYIMVFYASNRKEAKVSILPRTFEFYRYITKRSLVYRVNKNGLTEKQK